MLWLSMSLIKLYVHLLGYFGRAPKWHEIENIVTSHQDRSYANVLLNTCQLFADPAEPDLAFFIKGSTGCGQCKNLARGCPPEESLLHQVVNISYYNRPIKLDFSIKFDCKKSMRILQVSNKYFTLNKDNKNGIITPDR